MCHITYVCVLSKGTRGGQQTRSWPTGYCNVLGGSLSVTFFNSVRYKHLRIVGSVLPELSLLHFRVCWASTKASLPHTSEFRRPWCISLSTKPSRRNWWLIDQVNQPTPSPPETFSSSWWLLLCPRPSHLVSPTLTVSDARTTLWCSLRSFRDAGSTAWRHFRRQKQGSSLRQHKRSAFGTHTTSCLQSFRGTFPGDKNGRRVKLFTHVLVLRLHECRSALRCRPVGVLKGTAYRPRVSYKAMATTNTEYSLSVV